MKSLRKKYTWLTICFASLALVSCDDYLDVLPDNRMELKSGDEISQLLVSAYSEANPAYLLEMYSDNTDEHHQTGWTAASKFQEEAYRWEDINDVSESESPQMLWNSYYSAISAANLALQYIAQNENGTEDLSAQKGEALLCRAYNMFVLSTIFCNAYDETTAATSLGLPYPEKVETTVGETYTRGTLAELYAKIDADLTEGISLVGDTYDQPKFHFTRSAAYAFAARFYLYYHKYQKSVEYADKVLGSNPATKLRDWASWSSLSANDYIQPEAYVNSANKANLLLQVVNSSWGAINGPYLYGDAYAHGGLISMTETLQAIGPWGDASHMQYTVWHNSALAKYMLRTLCYSFEYIDIQAGIGYAHGEYPVFTTDETLLVRAEANAMLKNYEAAVKDINAELHAIGKDVPVLTVDDIRNFYSGIDYYTPESPTQKKEFNTSFAIEKNTQEPLLDCILQLRRIITMHAGMRMQDVKRYGITIYRRRVNTSMSVEAVTDVMGPKDPRRAIQLPQDVITAGLKPNPRTL